MVARIVVLAIPSQAPAQGVVRSQFSTERSWFKVSRFCYMLMKYSCDRRGFTNYGFIIYTQVRIYTTSTCAAVRPPYASSCVVESALESAPWKVHRAVTATL